MNFSDASGTGHRVCVVALLLAITLYAPDLRATPPIYRITEIGQSGGQGINGTAINSSGQVAGVNSQTQRAFHWNGSTLTELGTLGGSAARASDLNDSGHVVGSSSTIGDSTEHAFLWDGEFMQDLGTLGGTHSNALKMNNSGHVIGSAQITDDSAFHPFLWNGITMIDLGALGSGSGIALGINEAGWVTGVSGNRAFLYDGTTIHDLGTLGGQISSGGAINSAGQVAGASYTAGDFAEHLFLWDGTLMRDLGTIGREDLPLMSSITPTAMNDSGQITGWSWLDMDQGSTDNIRAFLWDGNQLLNLGTLGNRAMESRAFAIDSDGNVAGSVAGVGAFLWHGQRMHDLNDLVDPTDPLAAFVTLTVALEFNGAGQLLTSGSDSRGGGGSYVLTPVPNPNQVTTATGAGVEVEPVLYLPDSTSITTVAMVFDNVVAPGTTTVTASNTPVGGADQSPSAFEIGNPPVYYDVSTTASFSGPVTLCFSWDETQFEDEETIGVFHFESGSWHNVTTSLDTQANRVCGAVMTLSPFALFEAAEYQFAGFHAPVDNPPTRNVVKAGAAVPVKFSLGGDFGLGILAGGYPQSQQVACNSGAPSDLVSETVTAGSSGLTFDPVSGQYIYVWKTNKAWANQCRRFMLRLDDGLEQVAEFSFTK